MKPSQNTKSHFLRGKPNIENLAKAPSISCIFACKEEKAPSSKIHFLRGKTHFLRGNSHFLRGKPNPQTRIK
jgi:hypothetical protein